MFQTKNLIFLTLLVLFSFNTSSKLKSGTKLRQVVASEISTSAFCFLNNEGTVYNLNPLRASVDYQIEGADYTVDFNVCQDAKNTCKGQSGIVSWFNSTDVNDCSTIAGSQNVVSKWTLLCKFILNLSQPCR
jgi:hypothetical protein